MIATRRKQAQFSEDNNDMLFNKVQEYYDLIYFAYPLNCKSLYSIVEVHAENANPRDEFSDALTKWCMLISDKHN